MRNLKKKIKSNVAPTRKQTLPISNRTFSITLRPDEELLEEGIFVLR